MADPTDYKDYPASGKNPDGTDFVNPHPSVSEAKSAVGAEHSEINPTPTRTRPHFTGQYTQGRGKFIEKYSKD